LEEASIGSASAPRWVHKSASDDAADYIREQIFTGAYPADSRVPQDDVAAALGISRIPVREALVALQSEGFVTMPTNRGAFVNPFSASDIRSHFELRGYTLGLAARRCAQLENSGLVSRLESLYLAMRATEDPEEFYQVAGAFYLAIAEYGASPRITAALSRIHNIVPGNFYAIVPGSMAAARRGYGAEVRAQRQRDPKLAIEAAVKASLAQGECLIKLLAERGQLVDD
jgi:DNA-binding GntR family transcriptional regulator